MLGVDRVVQGRGKYAECTRHHHGTDPNNACEQVRRVATKYRAFLGFRCPGGGKPEASEPEYCSHGGCQDNHYDQQRELIFSEVHSARDRELALGQHRAHRLGVRAVFD